MAKEIVINSEKELSRIAILENGSLVELYIENPENARTLGDICLGKVRKIMPSIQAAFVDIGQQQDAFLHFSDLSDNLALLLDFIDQENPEVEKMMQHAEHAQRIRGKRHRPRGQRRGRRQSGDGDKKRAGGRSDAKARSERRSAQRRSRQKGQHDPDGNNEPRQDKKQSGGDADVRPETFLKRGQRIPVKIVKEPISNKGSRVSTDISLAGRFLVLVPLADYVAVSKKIQSYKERRRLRTLAKSLLPEGFGVIVRTVAEGRDAKSLDTDLRLLLDKWRKIEKNLAGKPNPPKEIHRDVNMVSSILRDLFSDDYDRVLIDDQRVYRNVKGYVQAIAPQMSAAVKMHTGKQHIFEAAGISKDVQQAFQSRVDLPSGGYLFIERTEAMHVVDVNSGRSGRGLSQEENSLRVNLESARMIARQIRLRDLGGIIVVDFIDLRDERNKRKVYDELKREFKKDRAVSKILPMSDFGLIQITRQRLRPSITTTFSQPDLTTNGSSDKPDHNDRPERNDKPERNERGGRNDKTSKADTEPKATEEEAPPQPSEPTSAREDQAPKNDGQRRRGGRGKRDRTPSVSPDELVQQMEQWLIDYKILGNRRAVTLRVHPFTAAYLNRKVPNHPTRWFMKHLIRVRLETDEAIAPTSYNFFDGRTDEDLTERIRAGVADMQNRG